MSDLSEYDKAIVDAVEKYVRAFDVYREHGGRSPFFRPVEDAVRAKWAAAEAAEGQEP